MHLSRRCQVTTKAGKIRLASDFSFAKLTSRTSSLAFILEGTKWNKSESIVPEASTGTELFILRVKTLIKTKNSIIIEVHGNKAMAMNAKFH